MRRAKGAGFGGIRAAICGLCLAALPILAQAKPVTLTPQEALAESYRQLAAGRPEIALRLAEVLVMRDGKSFAAHLIASYSARDTGDFARAQSHARTAYALAQTDAQRFDAAMAQAQALSSQGKRGRAQIWLRRAVQQAPNPASRARAIRDYKYVRARNPWSFNLALEIAPSDNVNGGASSSEWALGPFILPVPREMQALDGVAETLSMDLARTIAESEQAKTQIGVNVTRREIQLSASAQAEVPALRNRDFAFQSVEGYALHQRRLAQGTALAGEMTLRFALGQSRYGGAPLADFARIGAHYEWVIGAQKIGTHIGYERQLRQDRPSRSTAQVQIGLSWARNFAPRSKLGGQMSVTLDWQDVQSDSDAAKRQETSLRARYALRQPVFGMPLSVWAKRQWSEYDFSNYTNGPRHDARFEIGAEIALTGAEFMGFVPEIGLTTARTTSNSAFFESKETAVSLGLRSSF